MEHVLPLSDMRPVVDVLTDTRTRKALRDKPHLREKFFLLTCLMHEDKHNHSIVLRLLHAALGDKLFASLGWGSRKQIDMVTKCSNLHKSIELLLMMMIAHRREHLYEFLWESDGHCDDCKNAIYCLKQEAVVVTGYHPCFGNVPDMGACHVMYYQNLVLHEYLRGRDELLFLICDTSSVHVFDLS